MSELWIFALIGLAVGGLGSMLGIGGGVILIPLLTGLVGLPIKTAIGASIISVIATSSAAGAVYVGKGMSHTRLAMVLEIATTLGALAGGITAVLINPKMLSGVFALVLLYVFYSMGRKQAAPAAAAAAGASTAQAQNAASTPARDGVLQAEFVDPSSGQVVHYGVHRLSYGMGASFLAGNISGLLGIGGGIIKVPVMNLIMGMPIRAAIATSNFMIGITAATSAVIYYQHGYIDPHIAIPTALGVLAGAQLGSRLGGRLASEQLKHVFRWLLLLFAVQMGLKAFGVL